MVDAPGEEAAMMMKRAVVSASFCALACLALVTMQAQSQGAAGATGGGAGAPGTL
jgi:hypothetical protein